MKKFIKKFEPSTQDAKYAIVATHMNPNATTLDKMEKLLAPKGLTRISDGLKIKVTGMKGPCESGHEKQIDRFADEITTKM